MSRYRQAPLKERTLIIARDGNKLEILERYCPTLGVAERLVIKHRGNDIVDTHQTCEPYPKRTWKNQWSVNKKYRKEGA